MNNSLILAIVIGVAVVVVLVAVIAVYVMNNNKDKNVETDYRVFFILGISFLPIGIATENPGLWGMGAIFLLVGLANRDKWKKESKPLGLDPEKKRNKFLIILGLTILLVVAVGLYVLAKSIK